MDEKHRILSEDMERLEKESQTVRSIQICAHRVFISNRWKEKCFSASVSCSGPSDDQEDGQDEAADRAEAAPDLSEQPAVIWGQLGAQNLWAEYWAGEQR